MDTTWVYTGRDSAARLHVTFNEDTCVESYYDYIYIYDVNDELVGKYTGSELSGVTVTVVGNTVKIKLTTDVSVVNYGFKVESIEAEYIELEDIDDIPLEEVTSDAYVVVKGTTTLDLVIVVLEKNGTTFYSIAHTKDEFEEGITIELFSDEIPQSGDVYTVTVGAEEVYASTEFEILPKAEEEVPLPEEIYVNSVEELQSPHNYYNDMDTTWIYTHGEIADCLRVTFSEDTCTENNWDYIYIYNANDELVGKYTGNELAGATVEVSGNVVKVRLDTDDSVTAYGFRVDCIESEYAEEEPTRTEEIYVNSVEELQSPHNYYNDMDTTWIYTHSEDVDYLRVTFGGDTCLENNYDDIYIYDEAGVLVGEYTGTALAGATVEVPGNVVKIRLDTDGSGTYYGFKVESIEGGYYEVEEPTDEPIDPVVEATLILAGDSDGDGVADRTVEQGRAVVIATTAQNIPVGSTAEVVWEIVNYSGEAEIVNVTGDYNNILTIEGTVFGDVVIRGTLYVDGVATSATVTIYVAVEPGAPEEEPNLPEVIYVSSVQELQSPHNYYNNKDTTWIYTTDAEAMFITFSEDTYVEDDCDVIRIYDGEDKLIGEYTGYELSGTTVGVKDDTVKIQLVTDHSVTEYGFEVVEIEEFCKENSEDVDVVIPDTGVTKPQYTSFSITPVNVPVGSMIAALVMKDGIAYPIVKTYNGESVVTFNVPGGFDSIKILTWETLYGMNPIKEAVVVE